MEEISGDYLLGNLSRQRRRAWTPRNHFLQVRRCIQNRTDKSHYHINFVDLANLGRTLQKDYRDGALVPFEGVWMLCVLCMIVLWGFPQLLPIWM